MIAACWLGRVSILQALIDRGADVNLATKRGETPLWWTADSGQTQACELLIKSGAEVNKKDLEGKSPMDNAFSWSHYETVEILKANGGERFLLYT